MRFSCGALSISKEKYFMAAEELPANGQNLISPHANSSTFTTTDTLINEQPFVFFDLELTEKEREALEKLDIKYTSHYENYGDLQLLAEELQHFITSLSDSNIAIAKTVAQLVPRLVQKVLAILDQETAWVTMRAFTPVTVFKEPRWHSDSHYYPPTGEQYKVAITLHGAQTLFYDIASEQRKTLEPICQNKRELTKIVDLSRVISPSFGQGSIFIVGSDHAPIHSEPNIDGKRLFLSMIPGSNAQIKTLHKQTPEREVIKLLTSHNIYCYFVGPRIKETFGASPYEDTEIIIFRINDRLAPEFLETITKLVQLHCPDIKVEAFPKDPTLFKLNFSHGAIITLNNISRMFTDHISENRSDDMIFTTLKNYACNREASEMEIAAHIASNPDSADETAKLPKKEKNLELHPILGKNTFGLFKPRSSCTSCSLPEDTDESCSNKTIRISAQ